MPAVSLGWRQLADWAEEPTSRVSRETSIPINTVSDMFFPSHPCLCELDSYNRSGLKKNGQCTRPVLINGLEVQGLFGLRAPVRNSCRQPSTAGSSNFKIHGFVRFRAVTVGCAPASGQGVDVSQGDLNGRGPSRLIQGLAAGAGLPGGAGV